MAVDRYYYIQNWGFDPFKVRKDLSPDGTIYRYEKSFPLKADPLLHALQIVLVAQVIVNHGNIKLYLILKQNQTEIRIKCVHTILFEGSMQEIHQLGMGNIQKLIPSYQKMCIELQPEEHFVALAAFAENLANHGLSEQIQMVLIQGKRTIRLRKRLITGLWRLNPEVVIQIAMNYLKQGDPDLKHLEKYVSKDEIKRLLRQSLGLLKKH